jgi:hypothetical protein
MDYINTLSKFGVKLEDRNQRTKFNKLKTRYRVRVRNESRFKWS